MSRTKEIIDWLSLSPHPEGGWYRQVYQSEESIPGSALPGRFGADRRIATSIYFLLGYGNFSAFHRIKSDEIWHHYEGGPLQLFVISPKGELKMLRLGKQDKDGASPQLVVSQGCWFASKPFSEKDYCLVGCTVAPGFDFNDFELAGREELIQLYPQHQSIIRDLTRE